MVLSAGLLAFPVACQSSTDRLPRDISFAYLRGRTLVIVDNGVERNVIGQKRDMWDLTANASGTVLALTEPFLDSQIHIINADGTNEKLVTRERTLIDGIAFSPDGSQLAYAAKRPGRDLAYDLYIADLGTFEARLVLRAAYADHAPVWSPDGKTLAFRRRVPHPDGVTSLASDLCVVNIDGSGLRCLTDTAGSREFAIYSNWPIPLTQHPTRCGVC